MRLIDAAKLANDGIIDLREFFEADIPPYLILSHTWDREELTFQDATSGRAAGLAGHAKIVQTCRVALMYGLDFVWVDTCCIDKTSSAELTESINSMFRWYRNAAQCIVWLADLPADDGVPQLAELAQCRWFTRGWTLQELISPLAVDFFDSEWRARGDKLSLEESISQITGIDTSALRQVRPLGDFSVAHRMAWAAHRQTTRVEDMAYSLMGIFEVNFSLIYGEGTKAFRRLQEEIMKRSNDLTIFAWSPVGTATSPYCSILAPSPAEFARSNDLEPFDDLIGSEPGFTLNNRGLLITSALWTFPATGDDYGYGYGPDEAVLTFLELGSCPTRGHLIAGIFLRKVGPGFFFRDGRLPVRTFGQRPAGAMRVRTSELYMAVDMPARQD